MTDARLVATNPADSTLVPVSCNSRGELSTQAPKIELIPNDVEVAGDLTVTGTINGADGEPITGKPGPQGPPGADGKDGKDGEDGKDGIGQLPPDPFEGAFLGWLNNQLAWVGAAPIPIPSGVFGPITAYDAAGLLTVEGEIPSQIGTGVTVYQCNESGTIFVDGWNTSQVWSSNTYGSSFGSPPYTWPNAFNGDSVTGADDRYAEPAADTNYGVIFQSAIRGVTTLRIKAYTSGTPNNSYTIKIRTDQNELVDVSSQFAANTTWSFFDVTGITSIKGLEIWAADETNNYIAIDQIEVNGGLLVDKGDYPAPNLNFRVNSVNGQNLIGVANRTKNFSPGKFLRIPEQNVARWLYEGGKNGISTLP